MSPDPNIVVSLLSNVEENSVVARYSLAYPVNAHDRYM